MKKSTKRKSLKGRLRMGTYLNGPDCVYLELECETSGVNFLSLEMSLEEFSKATVGNMSASVTFELATNEALENVGKVWEISRQSLKLPKGWSKYSHEDQILRLIENHLKGMGQGWSLWQNGMKSQQNERGIHHWIAGRFVEKTDGNI